MNTTTETESGPLEASAPLQAGPHQFVVPPGLIFPKFVTWRPESAIYLAIFENQFEFVWVPMDPWFMDRVKIGKV